MNRMYEEGGLATDGMDVDPVSGNDIPAGSNAEDVRDDVDAKLSSGEYVVPADVVKYFGVAYFEKLRDKAKMGLEGMEADGRIGGEPSGVSEVTLGDDLNTLDGYAKGGMVEGMDVDAIINRVKAAAEADPSIINMLKAKGIFVQAPQVGQVSAPAAAPAAIATQQQPPAFNEGGGVVSPLTSQYDPANYTSSFNPYAHTLGYSIEAGNTGVAPGGPVTAPVSAPVAPVCPPGQAWDAVQNMCVPVGQPASSGGNGGSSDKDPISVAEPNAWMDKFDYSRPDVLFEETMTTIGAGSKKEDKSFLQALGGLAGSALSGGVIGKFISANNVAQASANAIILRESGRDEYADKLEAAIADYAKEKGVANLSDFTTGKKLAESAQGVKETFISKWGVGAGADQVTDKMVSDGQTYAATGDDRADTWDGGQVVANQNAPVYEANSSSSGSVEAMAAAQKAADKLGVKLATGGRATGGLVSRKVKLKPTKTNKTTTKKGLGRK